MHLHRFAATLILLIAPLTFAATERTQVTILQTTDLHGHILPVDYFTNKPAHNGLAKLGSIIRQIRSEQPEILLVDSGDTIQGTPLVSFHNRKNNTPPDPMMLAMNELGFDAMAIGNHEYNFGLHVFEKARREAKFPWLSANTFLRHSDECPYPAFIVKVVNGVRVAVLGLTTPGIPSWETPENYAGLEFRDPLAVAKKWVPILRERERADVVVVAMHMGLDRDLRTGERWPGQVGSENLAYDIATQVPGIDLVLMGHTHREVPSLLLRNVLCAQANRWGDRLVRADIYLEREDAGPWSIVAKSSRTIPVTESTAVDPAIARIAEPYDRETQAWLGRVIGRSVSELSARQSRLQDTAILDLIQHAQLESGAADVSMAASFNLEAKLPARDVTVRDIAGLYVYENTLVVIEVTGAQLKEALEHSAGYFKPYAAGLSARELIDDRMPGYNFDIAEGVDYTIDLSQPRGSRIVGLSFRGEPLAPGRTLRLAINSYRLNGGGGYSMYRDAPVVQRSSNEIRDAIIDWVEKHHEVPAEPNNNWRILVP